MRTINHPMNENKKISFVPEELLNLLVTDEWDKFILNKMLVRIDFKVFASTTSDEYRCRELDDYDMTIQTELPYTYQSKTQSYIYENMNVSCPNGKYPEINLGGVLCEDDKEYIDGDRNDAFLDFYGHVWIFLHD